MDNRATPDRGPYPATTLAALAPPLPPDGPPADASPSLTLENILLHRFDAANAGANLAISDRDGLLAQYATVLAVIIGGLGVFYQSGGRIETFSQVGATLILVFIGTLHFVIYGRLVRLRLELRENLLTMYIIQEFYILVFQRQLPNVGGLFRTRLDYMRQFEHSLRPVFILYYALAAVTSVWFAAAAFVGDEWALGVNHGAVDLMPTASQPAAAALIALVLTFGVLTFFRRFFTPPYGPKNQDAIVEGIERAAKSIP